MFYIYHIPQRKKIGVTENIKVRMQKHKWTGFYEILEEHTCEFKVSDREQELQREYGYPVDKRKYHEVRRMQTQEGSIKGAYAAHKLHSDDHYSNMGKASGVARRRFTDIQIEYIRAQYKRGKDVFGKRVGQGRLAKVFGVHRSTIADIVHNRIYTTP